MAFCCIGSSFVIRRMLLGLCASALRSRTLLTVHCGNGVLTNLPWRQYTQLWSIRSSRLVPSLNVDNQSKCFSSPSSLSTIKFNCAQLSPGYSSIKHGINCRCIHFTDCLIGVLSSFCRAYVTAFSAELNVVELSSCRQHTLIIKLNVCSHDSQNTYRVSPSSCIQRLSHPAPRQISCRTPNHPISLHECSRSDITYTSISVCIFFPIFLSFRTCFSKVIHIDTSRPRPRRDFGKRSKLS